MNPDRRTYIVGFKEGQEKGQVSSYIINVAIYTVDIYYNQLYENFTHPDYITDTESQVVLFKQAVFIETDGEITIEDVMGAVTFIMSSVGDRNN